MRRKPDLRKILIIHQLPAGRRGEGLPVRKQPRSAHGSSVYGQLRGTESPDSFQQTGRLPTCPVLQRRSSRSSSQPRRSSLPEGGFEPTGKTLFSASGHCSLLIRRPLKMEREAAAAWRFSRSADQCGRCASEFAATCDAQTPARVRISNVTRPLPSIPLQGQTWFW